MRKQQAEQSELLNAVAEGLLCFPVICERYLKLCLLGLRNESTNQHQATLEAVRQSASEQVNFNVEHVSFFCGLNAINDAHF
jgi:hypothetical protein